ncbi:hypothetical protein SAMN05421853_101343 [Roseivivax halotolerans]|uniref:histidine kinase n=1 Tax=Roseivivax halotolerans TaxID=93684 RepID=A0A1I5V5B7_9RHOB|nr:PAS-domain containing protein [Roseivivax halotolerans]SFQ02724.1 hypothetical protein SAMN05421853_101343 [Roseivivax halotolerans]
MTLSKVLAEERRARLAAEKLLAQKHAELTSANRRLGLHTRELAQEVSETRARVASMQTENARVISELGNAVQKIEVVESQLWQALEAIRDGFALFDAEGRLELANRAYLSMYDGIEEVWTGTHFSELLRLAAEEGLVDIGAENPADWIDRIAAGWTNTRSKPPILRLWDGRFVKVENRPTADGGTVSLAVDMTELMRMWSAVQELPDGFVLFDADDRLVMCNEKYRQLYSKSAPAIVPGATFEDILRYGLKHGQYLDAVGREEEWLAERLASHRRPEIVLEQPLDDGRWLRIFERRTSDGARVGLRVDISHLKQTQADLEKAMERAEAANRAKSAFLANMSHEIRTPMNGVVSMSELLVSTTLDDEQRLYAETIRNSGEALLEIINDVLDFSKIEADRIEIAVEPFDLERLIHDLVTLVQTSARKKGLALLVDYDIFLPSRFRGDAARVRQVLTNLIGNAIKFTHEGHVLVRIVGLGEERGRTTLHITVEDTGIGIPKSQQAHVFGVFNQVEDGRDRSFEGTGLGLAITKRLIELMGGEIWLKSEPGRGSCFGIRLVLPNATDDEGSGLPDLRHIRRALVLDAHAGSRAILSRQLGQAGIAALTSAMEAEFDTMRQAPWDVAIIADDIPGATAAELARRWRTAGETRPLILSAALPDRERKAIGDGCFDAVVQRPTPRAALFAALARIEMASVSESPCVFHVAGHETETRIDVLLAEDNATNQLVFSKMVADLPIRLRVASNGQDALDEIAARRPDLVFMDISMPGMDGKEATRRLRQSEADTGAPRLPVIAVTAHAMDGDREAILAEGLDDYIVKPVRKAAIRNAIERALPGVLRDGADQAALDAASASRTKTGFPGSERSSR